MRLFFGLWCGIVFYPIFSCIGFMSAIAVNCFREGYSLGEETYTKNESEWEKS